MYVTDIALAEKIGLEKRCGYWKILDRFYFNKAECLKYASILNSPVITYHFLDSAYKTLDWSKEPSLDIEVMYKQRAQQLRDKYDYLILAFSGGADSSNILNTFIDNGIKLDEIYCEYPINPLEKIKHKFTGDRKDPTLLNFEWYTAAKPALESLAKTHPHIKITVEDASDLTIQIIENDELYKMFRAGFATNPNSTKYYRLYEICRERQKFGNVACIMGLDKPRIAYDTLTKDFYSSYSDFSNVFSEFPHDTFSGYQATIEFFYYSADYPSLNQKQCFMLKNEILKIMHTNVSLYNSLYKQLPNGVRVFDVHHDFFKKILYKKWNTSIWQAEKSFNFFYTPASQWFHDEDVTTHRSRDFYDKQLLDLIQGIDSKYITYDKSTPIAFNQYLTQAIPF